MSVELITIIAMGIALSLQQVLLAFMLSRHIDDKGRVTEYMVDALDSRLAAIETRLSTVEGNLTRLNETNIGGF